MGKKFKSVSLNATIITILFVLVFLGTIFVNTSNGGKDLSAVALTGDTGNITANWGTPTDKNTSYWKGNSSFTFNSIPSDDGVTSFTLTTSDEYNKAFSSRTYGGRKNSVNKQENGVRANNVDFFQIVSSNCPDNVACLNFNINPTLLADIQMHQENYTLTITMDVNGTVYSGGGTWIGPMVDYFVINSQQAIPESWNDSETFLGSIPTKKNADYTGYNKGENFSTPNQTITVAGANLGEHNAFYIRMIEQGAPTGGINKGVGSGIDVSHKNVTLSLQKHDYKAPTISNVIIPTNMASWTSSRQLSFTVADDNLLDTSLIQLTTTGGMPVNEGTVVAKTVSNDKEAEKTKTITYKFTQNIYIEKIIAPDIKGNIVEYGINTNFNKIDGLSEVVDDSNFRLSYKGNVIGSDVFVNSNDFSFTFINNLIYNEAISPIKLRVQYKIGDAANYTEYAGVGYNGGFAIPTATNASSSDFTQTITLPCNTGEAKVFSVLFWVIDEAGNFRQYEENKITLTSGKNYQINLDKITPILNIGATIAGNTAGTTIDIITTALLKEWQDSYFTDNSALGWINKSISFNTTNTAKNLGNSYFYYEITKTAGGTPQPAINFGATGNGANIDYEFNTAISKLTFYVVSQSGNKSAIKSFAIKQDTAVPGINIVHSGYTPDAEWNSGRTPQGVLKDISWTIKLTNQGQLASQDGIAKVWCAESVDGKTYGAAKALNTARFDKDFLYKFFKSEDVSVNKFYKIYIESAAGNKSEEVIFSVKIDNAVPQIKANNTKLTYIKGGVHNAYVAKSWLGSELYLNVKKQDFASGLNISQSGCMVGVDEYFSQPEVITIEGLEYYSFKCPATEIKSNQVVKLRLTTNAGNATTLSFTAGNILVDRVAPTFTVLANDGAIASGTWTKDDVVLSFEANPNISGLKWKVFYNTESAAMKNGEYTNKAIKLDPIANDCDANYRIEFTSGAGVVASQTFNVKRDSVSDSISLTNWNAGESKFINRYNSASKDYFAIAYVKNNSGAINSPLSITYSFDNINFRPLKYNQTELKLDGILPTDVFENGTLTIKISDEAGNTPSIITRTLGVDINDYIINTTYEGARGNVEIKVNGAVATKANRYLVRSGDVVDINATANSGAQFSKMSVNGVVLYDNFGNELSTYQVSIVSNNQVVDVDVKFKSVLTIKNIANDKQKAPTFNFTEVTFDLKDSFTGNAVAYTKKYINLKTFVEGTPGEYGNYSVIVDVTDKENYVLVKDNFNLLIYKDAVAYINSDNITNEYAPTFNLADTVKALRFKQIDGVGTDQGDVLFTALPKSIQNVFYAYRDTSGVVSNYTSLITGGVAQAGISNNAGTYLIKMEHLADSNYPYNIDINFLININKKGLEISKKNVSLSRQYNNSIKYYSDNALTFDVLNTLVNFINVPVGVNLATDLKFTTANLNYADKNVGDNKQLSISGVELANPNYKLDLSKLVFYGDITKRQIELVSNNVTYDKFIYNNTNILTNFSEVSTIGKYFTFGFDGATSNALFGENVSVNIAGAGFKSKNATESNNLIKFVSPQIYVDGAVSNNYIIINADSYFLKAQIQKFNISGNAITFKNVAGTKEFDGNPVICDNVKLFEITVSGMIGSDGLDSNNNGIIDGLEDCVEYDKKIIGGCNVSIKNKGNYNITAPTGIRSVNILKKTLNLFVELPDNKLFVNAKYYDGKAVEETISFNGNTNNAKAFKLYLADPNTNLPYNFNSAYTVQMKVATDGAAAGQRNYVVEVLNKDIENYYTIVTSNKIMYNILPRPIVIDPIYSNALVKENYKIIFNPKAKTFYNSVKLVHDDFGTTFEIIDNVDGKKWDVSYQAMIDELMKNSNFSVDMSLATASGTIVYGVGDYKWRLLNPSYNNNYSITIKDQPISIQPLVVDFAFKDINHAIIKNNPNIFSKNYDGIGIEIKEKITIITKNLDLVGNAEIDFSDMLNKLSFATVNETVGRDSTYADKYFIKVMQEDTIGADYILNNLAVKDSYKAVKYSDTEFYYAQINAIKIKLQPKSTAISFSDDVAKPIFGNAQGANKTLSLTSANATTIIDYFDIIDKNGNPIANYNFAKDFIVGEISLQNANTATVVTDRILNVGNYTYTTGANGLSIGSGNYSFENAYFTTANLSVRQLNIKINSGNTKTFGYYSTDHKINKADYTINDLNNKPVQFLEGKNPFIITKIAAYEQIEGIDTEIGATTEVGNYKIIITVQIASGLETMARNYNYEVVTANTYRVNALPLDLKWNIFGKTSDVDRLTYGADLGGGKKYIIDFSCFELNAYNKGVLHTQVNNVIKANFDKIKNKISYEITAKTFTEITLSYFSNPFNDLLKNFTFNSPTNSKFTVDKKVINLSLTGESVYGESNKFKITDNLLSAYGIAENDRQKYVEIKDGQVAVVLNGITFDSAIGDVSSKIGFSKNFAKDNAEYIIATKTEGALTVPDVAVNFKINARPLWIDVASLNKIYLEANPTIVTTSFYDTSLVNGTYVKGNLFNIAGIKINVDEAHKVVATPNFTGFENAGAYNIPVDITNTNSNFNLINVSGYTVAYVINAKDIKVQVTNVPNKVFDNNASNAIAIAFALATGTGYEGNTLKVGVALADLISVERELGEKVGLYKIGVTPKAIDEAKNYKFALISEPFAEIKRASVALSLSLNKDSFEYGVTLSKFFADNLIIDITNITTNLSDELKQLVVAEIKASAYDLQYSTDNAKYEPLNPLRTNDIGTYYIKLIQTSSFIIDKPSPNMVTILQKDISSSIKMDGQPDRTNIYDGKAFNYTFNANIDNIKCIISKIEYSKAGETPTVVAEIKNAGKYNVTISIAYVNDYLGAHNYKGEIKMEIDILQRTYANLQINDAKNYEYGILNIYPKLFVEQVEFDKSEYSAFSTATPTFYKKGSATALTGAPSEVGEYTVKYDVVDTFGNYKNASLQIDYVIAKSTIKVDISNTEDTIVREYKKPNKPIEIVGTNSQFLHMEYYKVTAGGEQLVSAFDFATASAGKYNFKINFKDSANGEKYKIVVSKGKSVGTFEIKKAVIPSNGIVLEAPKSGYIYDSLKHDALVADFTNFAYKNEIVKSIYTVSGKSVEVIGLNGDASGLKNLIPENVIKDGYKLNMTVMFENYSNIELNVVYYIIPSDKGVRVEFDNYDTVTKTVTFNYTGKALLPTYKVFYNDNPIDLNSLKITNQLFSSSAAVDNAIDVGNYYIQFTFSQGENWSFKQDLQIAINPSAGVDTLVYNKTAEGNLADELVYDGKIFKGKFDTLFKALGKYEVEYYTATIKGDKITYKKITTDIKNAGEYYIRFFWDAEPKADPKAEPDKDPDANYSGISEYIKFTIKKAVFDFSFVNASDTTVVFNGAEQGIAITGLPSGSKIKYLDAKDKGVTMINAGVYTVKMLVTNANYEDFTIGAKKMTITPAVLNVEIEKITNKEIVVKPIANAMYSIDGVNYQYENEFKNLTENTEYTVYVRVEGSDVQNYINHTEGVTSYKTFTLTAKKKGIDISLVLLAVGCALVVVGGVVFTTLLIVKKKRKGKELSL